MQREPAATRREPVLNIRVILLRWHGAGDVGDEEVAVRQPALDVVQVGGGGGVGRQLGLLDQPRGELGADEVEVVPRSFTAREAAQNCDAGTCSAVPKAGDSTAGRVKLSLGGLF